MVDPIIGPFLAQIGLTIAVVFWLAYARFSYIGKHGLAKVRDEGFPVRAVNASDNLKHQFEVPVLFFAICLLFATVLETTSLVVALAWTFVVFRVLQAIVQLTTNTIFPWRFGAFFIGTLALVALYIVAVLQYFAA